jgi:hypothetical protein
MKPSIAIGITTFHAPMRLRKLIEILRDQGSLEYFSKVGIPIRIFQDPWRKHEYDNIIYDQIGREYRLPLTRLPKWSCMQGSAEFAVENSPEDWFIYLPDDVLPAPGALNRIVDWIIRLDRSPVGALQVPYWNADELPNPPWAPGGKEAMWHLSSEWLWNVPKNPHWEITGKPYPYVNLNGAGFAIRRATWQAVGGFSQETWCLDEDMGAKIWLRTAEIIVALPGPPFVHYMGGALDHPEHHFHCLDCWHKAGWPDKDEVHRQCRAVMKERCGTVKDDDPFTLLDEYLPVKEEAA